LDKQIEATQASFEEIKHIENNVEFWSARELMPLLEYTTWEKFENAIKRAIIAAQTSGASLEDHFPGAAKLVLTGSGAERKVTDYKLTRYACYLIAQNGDPRKKAIAQAQTYFAAQTRKQELTDQHQAEVKRVEARERLTATEKKFSGVLNAHGVDSKGIAEIRSSGDQELFGGHSTADMKSKYGVPSAKPLADYLPTITLKAKDLATEMTSVNTLQNELQGKPIVKREHDQNNRSVRQALLERSIKPEALAAQEDIGKVKRRLGKAPKELKGKE